LFAWRAPKLAPGAAFDLASRETGILLNNLLLTAAAATILTGTLYPLVLDATEGIKISVGPPYFTATVVPMFALLAVLMPLGPIFMWRRSDWRASLYKLRFAFAAAMVAMLVVLAVLRPDTVLGLLAVTLGVWLIGGSVSDIARRAGSFRKIRHLPAVAWTSALAHAGLGVVALGVVGATSWKSEAIQVLSPGQSMNVGSYALRLDSTEQVQGPNYTADRAAITVMSNGRVITIVHPEKRSYPVEQMVTSQSSIRTTVVSDLYVVLGDSREGGGWVVRAYVNPMAPFIWLGAVVMAFAGFIALGARLAAKLRAARIAAGTVAEPAE
jgi:cytochrome c-type biogenesis protein CcmF